MSREASLKEEWKDIEGYEGLYQISNLGRVKSLKRNTKNQCKNAEVIKTQEIRNGYYSVSLWKNGVGKHHLIHRLISQAFIPNPNNKPQINHIDGNKTNNHIENLEWVTESENARHAYNNGLIKPYTRKIIQYDQNMNFIKEWDSITEIEKELGINHANIVTVCKQNTNRKYAGGYIWRYKEEANK